MSPERAKIYKGIKSALKKIDLAVTKALEGINKNIEGRETENVRDE